GSDEILAFAFMGLFEPGNTIRFPDITYSFYPVYSKVFNIDYETVPLNPDFTIDIMKFFQSKGGFIFQNPNYPTSLYLHVYYYQTVPLNPYFTIDITKFFQSKGGVIFPNPNAPTSLYLQVDDIETIVRENPDQIVIIDEAYVDFAEQSAVGLIEKYENVLVIQTMSKSRSLAGLRVGFAMGNEQLIEALIRMKDSFNSYPVDRLALAGATAAMKDKEYFKETTKKIIATRET